MNDAVLDRYAAGQVAVSTKTIVGADEGACYCDVVLMVCRYLVSGVTTLYDVIHVSVLYWFASTRRSYTFITIQFSLHIPNYSPDLHQVSAGFVTPPVGRTTTLV